MKLPTYAFGTPDDCPIVLVHGLFGQARNLTAIARGLSKDRFVITLDLRNHGAAQHADVHDYPAMSSDIFETLEAYPQYDLLGHSMGGKAAMHLALTRPEKIRALIVADIAPVTYTHSHAPFIDAMLDIDITQLKSRSDADTALKDAIPDDGTRAFLIHSLALRETPPRWILNLPALAQYMSTITSWPDISATFTKPTLFLGGKNSDYIRSEHRDAIKSLFPEAKITHIKDAGHWLHAEQPEIFTQIVSSFFAA